MRSRNTKHEPTYVVSLPIISFISYSPTYSMCPFLLHTYMPTCVVFYLATYNLHVNMQYMFTYKSISMFALIKVLLFVYHSWMKYYENMGFDITCFFPYIFFLFSITRLVIHIELICHVVTINMHGSIMWVQHCLLSLSIKWLWVGIISQWMWTDVQFWSIT